MHNFCQQPPPLKTKKQAAMAAVPPPEDFRCPISLEIMKDPVILPSGHTFDRVCIQRWLDAGNRTCPISKQPLPEHPSLIPNFALRSLISNFTQVSSPLPQPYSVDPQEVIRLLLSPSLKSPERVALLDQLTRVSKTDSRLLRILAESGAVSVVVKCIDSGEPVLQEKALHFLLNLSLDDDSKVGLVAEGIVGKVVFALRRGVGDSRAVAATVITSLAVVEVNKVAVGSYPEAIAALVNLLRIGNSRERKEATTALFMLSTFPDNRVRAIQCKAIPILIENANSGSERAIEVLNLLVKSKQGRDEMVRSSSILGILIGILSNGSCRAVQHALSILTSLCSHSQKMCFKASSFGVLDICVGFLDSEIDKIRRNANSLIQVLQENQR